jgi:hypothetical protein
VRRPIETTQLIGKWPGVTASVRFTASFRGSPTPRSGKNSGPDKSSAWPESNHLDQSVQNSLRIFTKSTASRFSTLEEFFTEAGNVLILSQHYELPAIFTVFHIDAQGVPKFCVDFETSNT